MSSSWLAGCIRRRLPAGDGHRIPCPLRESLEGLPTDPRKPRGKRHPLPSPVSEMVAGVASGHGGAQAVAQAAIWDQDVLAGHGCRISPRTGLRVPPSASMLDRLPRLLDADEFEAAPSACLAQAALDPAIPAAYSCRPRRHRLRERAAGHPHRALHHGEFTVSETQRLRTCPSSAASLSWAHRCERTGRPAAGPARRGRARGGPGRERPSPTAPGWPLPYAARPKGG